MPKPTPDQNRMKWAVEFMNMDLEPLREENLVTETEKQIARGDLARLRVGFARFFGEQIFPLVRTDSWPDYKQLWGPRDVIVSPKSTDTEPSPQDFTIENFASLQPRVRKIIEWDAWQSKQREQLQAEGQLNKFEIARESRIGPKEPLKDLNFEIKLSKEGWHYQEVSGPTSDAFIYKLIDLIRNQTTEQIHHCKHCGKIFFQIGKKRFCSTAHSRAAKKSTTKPTAKTAKTKRRKK